MEGEREREKKKKDTYSCLFLRGRGRRKGKEDGLGSSASGMKERAGVKQLRRGKNLETLTNPWVDSSFSPYLFHGLSSYRFSVSRFGLIPETTVRGRQPPLSFQKNRIVGEGTIRKRPERLGWTLITATLNSRRWVVEKKKEKRRVSTRLPPFEGSFIAIQCDALSISCLRAGI